MTAKTLEIALPFGEQSFFCPVCGAILDEEYEVLGGDCEHLLFYMNEDAGVFERIDVSLEEKLEEIENWKDWAEPPTRPSYCVYMRRDVVRPAQACFTRTSFLPELDQ